MARTARRARQLRFHKVVQRVVDTLPDHVQELLDDVAIVVQDEPDARQLRDSDLNGEDELFGLYQGIPRTERGSGYTMVAPDRITIFAGPLSRACETRYELEEEIRTTVLHELGHH
ncbi:MAG TPA: metallopeptidase family protein, partial [Thermomicrobiales bacterium]|nr:metallopeptidase family protein [Thermomicrobiales bacterium]